MKCLGRGAWPRWEEALRVAWLHWKREMSKGQEGVGWRRLVLRKIKANSGSTPGNLSSVWISTHCETFPLGKCWKPPRSCQQRWGWLELQEAPGGNTALERAGVPGLFWFIWSHQSNLSCRAQCRQGPDWQPGLAEQGQEKPILQLVGWVTTGVHRPTVCTGTKSTGQCFSLGSGLHLRENPNFTVWYQTSW